MRKTKLYINCQKTRIFLAKSPLPIKILQRNYGKCRWSQDTIVMWRYRKDEAVYKLSRDKDVFSKPCKEPYLWKYFREITHTFIHKITIPMNMKTLTICKIDKRPDFSSAQRSDKRSFELSIQYTTQGSKKKLFFITNNSLSDVNAAWQWCLCINKRHWSQIRNN